MQDDVLPELLLDQPSLMGVESIGVDEVKLRMVARTLPGKQFDVGRRLRQLVVAGLRREGISSRAAGNRRRGVSARSERGEQDDRGSGDDGQAITGTTMPYRCRAVTNESTTATTATTGVPYSMRPKTVSLGPTSSQPPPLHPADASTCR